MRKGGSLTPQGGDYRGDARALEQLSHEREGLLLRSLGDDADEVDVLRQKHNILFAGAVNELQ